MCIENLGNRVKGPIVAWKIFRYDRNRRLTGVAINFKYKIGQTVQKCKTLSPGFQAFVNREDAEYAITQTWLTGCVVRKVLLYDAALGVIKGMDSFCDGKPGWDANKICVPRKRKD